MKHLKAILSKRAIEDQRLLKLIKEFYIASSATYGSPWIHRDLRDAGEICSVHRVARIMRENKLKAQIGYKRRYIAYSRRNLPLIPEQACHPFQTKAATDSRAKLRPWQIV